MLSKVCKNLFSTGANVWVNKHTKVICQGITGNQVSSLSFRDLSKLNRHLTIIPRWLEVSIPKKQAPPTWDSLSLKIVMKLKNRQDVMLPLFTFHPLEQPVPSLKHLTLNSTSV